MQPTVYTPMAHATLFHFAHYLGSSAKAGRDMINFYAGAFSETDRADVVSKLSNTAQLSNLGGEIIVGSRISPDH